MNVTGTIIEIFETQKVSDKFTKRELVVQTGDEYPQSILIQFTQDKCGVLDSYKVGEQVEVGINLRGRAWKSPKGEIKYFNTIEGWKIGYSGSHADAIQGEKLNNESNDLSWL